MPNTYTISVQKDSNGNLLIKGNAANGVIQQVAWQLTGTDGGGHSWTYADTLNLPPIDPSSPNFIPLPAITEAILLQWAQALLNLPGIKAFVGGEIERLQDAPTNPVVPLQLAPAVAAQATAGVPV